MNTNSNTNNNMFEQQSSAMTIPNSNNNDSSQPINISFSRNGSVYQNPRVRRESIAHSQGMGGISWGSVTIGSWLKDEVMLHNQQNVYNNNSNALSPFFGAANTNQFVRGDSLAMSPSFNTSSYLADLEANYCKDYSCCGQLLPTLHDLLRHYEEMHIQPEMPIEAPRARPINNGMDIVSTNEVFLSHTDSNNNSNMRGLNNNFMGGQQIPNQDSLAQNLNNFSFNQSGADSGNNGNGQFNNQQQFQNQQQVKQQFRNQQLQQQQQQQQPQSGFQPNGQMQNQRLFQQTFNPHQRQNTQSPLSAINGNLQQQQPILTPAPTINSPQQQFAMDEDEDMEEQDVCIDDPARHLYVIEHTENRPFKCPVVGCEKNYKNQNGLKYHRAHGHQNQKLRENPDGTFSVIDPESDAPYPDGMGMEKDKPYRCEVCGKRYKNLNGLKYHRGHSTH